MDGQVETDRFGGAARDRGRGWRYREFTRNESRQFECLEAEQRGADEGLIFEEGLASCSTLDPEQNKAVIEARSGNSEKCTGTGDSCPNVRGRRCFSTKI